MRRRTTTGAAKIFGFRAPYGKAGDRLWVRETFYCDHYGYPEGEADGISKVSDGNGGWRNLTLEEKRRDMLDEMYYRADGEDQIPEAEAPITWTPSIHMPRWASRITLEITHLRVERLQEISEADAKAEGVTIHADAVAAAALTRGEETPARLEFWDLWKTINGKESWATNPWVWVIEFKKL